MEPHSSTPSKNTSYRESIKATTLTGASSLAVVLFGMVKSKVIAVTVGPDGIGLFGILNSIVGLVLTFIGMGINRSGVRQVASATAAADPLQIARVVYVLRRLSVVLGLTGAALIAMFAESIARYATGSPEYAHYLVILAPMVLFMMINGSQTALLRGMRRIAQLAKLNIFGAFVGAVTAIPIVLLWRLDGVPPAMVTTAGAALLASWWYARRAQVPTITMSRYELWHELTGLFGLGFAFFLTEIMISALRFGLRTILLHQTDLYTVGQFVAAVALSHVYVNFVLQAMGLDYLPRLTQVQDRPETFNRLINEQTEIALLVGGPGMVGFTILAPILIPLFYSARFMEASEVFRWQCLGVLIQMVSWPLGATFIARGMQRYFVGTQAALNFFYLASFSLMVRYFGLFGAAISFIIAQIFYLSIVFPLVHRLTDFQWSTGTRRIFLIISCAYTAGLASHQWLEGLWRLGVGAGIVLITSIWAYCELEKRLELSMVRLIIDKVRNVLRRLGIKS